MHEVIYVEARVNSTYLCSYFDELHVLRVLFINTMTQHALLIHTGL